MLASYGLIIAKLRESRLRSSIKLNERKSNIKVSMKSEKDRKRVTLMCSSLVLSFTFCWIIYHATHLGKIFGIEIPKGYVSNLQLFSKLKRSFSMFHIFNNFNKYL